MSKLGTWFLNSPTRFFLVATIVVLAVIVPLDLFLFSRDRITDILVEAHGLFFDLLVFGIVLTAYELIKSKKERIERYKEELEDYRLWEEKEATCRIIGIVKRLNLNGVSKINLLKCFLPEAHLVKFNLQGACLVKANLNRAFLNYSNFQEANLNAANLQEANLNLTNLRGAHLVGTNLQGANLIGANLQEAFLYYTSAKVAYPDYTNTNQAYLGVANLKGARVDSIDWIEKLFMWEVDGAKEIESKYYVDKTAQRDESGVIFHVIKEK